MARTTAAAVQVIINTDLTSGQISSYINIASILLTDLFLGVTITAVLLEEIERWLTAHLISITKERIAKKESVEKAAIEYIGEYGKGLNATSYGQTALLLDSTKTLQRLTKQTIQVIAIKQKDD